MKPGTLPKLARYLNVIFIASCFCNSRIYRSCVDDLLAT
jgi:hypothetical protein